MRTQDCREALDKVAEFCGITQKQVKKIDPVTALCREKGNEPLKHCATSALLPIVGIKDPKIKKAVIAEANHTLSLRDEKGDFIKDRLTQGEVEEIISKHNGKPPILKVRDEGKVRYRLNKQQTIIIKRLISLKCASDEKAAFSLIFKWAAERIAKKTGACPIK